VAAAGVVPQMSIRPPGQGGGTPEPTHVNPSPHSRRASVARARRSSLQRAESDKNTALATIQERVAHTNEPDEDGQVKYEDPMEPSHLALLNTPPEDRESDDIFGIAEMLSKDCADFCSLLTENQQSDIARCALYHFFTPGVLICDPNEETAFFFLVLHGSVQIEERQVHHQEGTFGAKAETSMRTAIVQAGKGFHHFPLVTQARTYGYSARVVAPTGASVLLISKEDYVSILRRSIEKEMNDTVGMLKATPLFSSWSATSVARLYFWFERKRFGPEEDVVREGDNADFCFIIRSGSCDVLVELPPEERTKGEGSVADSEQGGATPGSSPMPPSRPPGAMMMRAAAMMSPTQSPASMRPPLSRQSSVGSQRRSDMLKMGAAHAFLGGDRAKHVPLRANMRHVVTLHPGAIVGEIALFQDGVKRMATVRASGHVEVLVLEKRTFLDLDRSTLNLIAENARYNAACTKEPGQRGRDDLQILQQRTAHLSHLSALSSDVHIELCRVMRYRKVNEATMLVRKGMPASCLYILMAGAASLFSNEPARRKWSLASGALKDASLRSKKNASVDAFQGMSSSSTLRAGQAIGEEELLEAENPVYAVTAITTEPTELMEIDRVDFDRILKAGSNSDKGRLIDFLNSLSMMEGISIAAIHALSHSLTRKSFMSNQLCLCHPPAAELGPASLSSDYVYVIYSGEAQLLCGADPNDKRPAPSTEVGAPLGPTVDSPHPGNHKVERYLGAAQVPVATLGPGECVADNLLPYPTSRWCLKPITACEVLMIPRKDWTDTLRSSSLAALRRTSEVKAAFFQQHLDHTIEQTAAMHLAAGRRTRRQPVTSPGVRSISANAQLASPERNAYAPIGSPRSSSSKLAPLDATSSPTKDAAGSTHRSPSPSRSPRIKGGEASMPRSARKGESLPPLPSSPGSYTPAIRLGKNSDVGRRPMMPSI